MHLDCELVMKLHVLLNSSVKVGEALTGYLTVIPIAGVSFAGPNIRGTFCTGGAD